MGDRLYKLVTDDGEGADLSKGISREAAEVVPENFGRQVLATVASKTGDQFTKPGLILTWLLSALGAPAISIGLLVPVREAGSLLPQVLMANLVGRYAIHKFFWVIGSILQGLAVIGIGLAALSLKGNSLGWTVVGLLVLFSLSRAICSITSKDLLGKTIPKARRGRLNGLASSISGWVAVAVGLFFAFNPAKELPLPVFTGMIFAAGILWFAAASLMSRVFEFPGSTSNGKNPLREMLESLHFLKDDPTFLRFCIARALLASTVLSMPFYVVLAHQASGGRMSSFGLLMISGSLATALSGVVWGKLSDHSSRTTLAVAGLSAGLIGLLTAGASALEISETLATFIYGGLFFMIGLSHTGIRNGRKTYLVDHADQDNRAKLVAVSNTLMGLVLLLSGSFGLLAQTLGERAVIIVFALLGIAGSLVAFTLPEAGKGQ
ncbi:MAG: MFS transporter [Verrucomicrobiae bacterium]|nr:MFS transporter [Verrucomicrobiae bacterium]